MTADVDSGLNEIISKAIETKIEAAVVAALGSDDLMGRWVTAALQQVIEIPDGTGYGKKRVPFLTHIIQQTLQKAVNAAVKAHIVNEAEFIQGLVAKEMRRASNDIAAQFVAQLTEKTIKSTYGLEVQLRFPRE